MTRISLDKKNREKLFKLLKKQYGTLSYFKLAKKIGVPYKSLQNWIYGERLIPTGIIPNKLLNKIKIEQIRENNWGQIKGGLIGGKIAIKKLLSKYSKKELIKWRKNIGKKGAAKANKTLKKLKHKNPDYFYILLRKKKFAKNFQKLSKKKLQKKEIMLDTKSIPYSPIDIKKEIRLPTKLTPELAEIIGAHTGDGTLSTKRYYFSIRTSIFEEEYFTKHVFPLYKRTFNINLKLLKRPPICGFETSSKAIHYFKNQIFGLPIGTKTHKIGVSPLISESNDKKIMGAFLRGVFDTDGCVYFSKHQTYPVLSITVKSKKAIKGMGLLLKKLGYDPHINLKSYTVYLNGVLKFKKWLDEIGTKNPKHQKRINKIKEKLPWAEIEKTLNEISNIQATDGSVV
ncbi:MAG: LAGLIDADG family homing endonuclease [archaeon]